METAGAVRPPLHSPIREWCRWCSGAEVHKRTTATPCTVTPVSGGADHWKTSPVSRPVEREKPRHSRQADEGRLDGISDTARGLAAVQGVFGIWLKGTLTREPNPSKNLTWIRRH